MDDGRLSAWCCISGLWLIFVCAVAIDPSRPIHCLMFPPFPSLSPVSPLPPSPSWTASPPPGSPIGQGRVYSLPPMQLPSTQRIQTQPSASSSWHATEVRPRRGECYTQTQPLHSAQAYFYPDSPRQNRSPNISSDTVHCIALPFVHSASVCTRTADNAKDPFLLFINEVGMYVFFFLSTKLILVTYPRVQSIKHVTESIEK